MAVPFRPDHVGPGSVGVALASVHDAVGLVARSSQALLVAARQTSSQDATR